MKIFYLLVAILMFVLGILNLLDMENELSFLLTAICINSYRIKVLEEKDEKI